jgi:hypothetical protein
MAPTITNLKEIIFGNKRALIFDMAIGAVAATGVTLLPATLGLVEFETVLIEPSGGYSYTYDLSTHKIYAFRQPASTSTGAITAPITVSQGAVTISGPAGGSERELQLSNDSASAFLTHASGSTLDALAIGIPKPTATIAPTFAGGAGEAALAAASATLTVSTTARVLAIGY